MSDLRQNLKSEFRNEDYRYAYAQSFLNTKLAMQIKVLREARRKKQSELGALIGTKQSGFSRFEDVNHSVWKTDTLWKIARALGVRLNISFETFGSLVDEKERFSRDYLLRPDFEHDPAFTEVSQGAVPQDTAGAVPKETTPILGGVRTPAGLNFAVLLGKGIGGAEFGAAVRSEKSERRYFMDVPSSRTAKLEAQFSRYGQGVLGFSPILHCQALSGAIRSLEDSQMGSANQATR